MQAAGPACPQVQRPAARVELSAAPNVERRVTVTSVLGLLGVTVGVADGDAFGQQKLQHPGQVAQRRRVTVVPADERTSEAGVRTATEREPGRLHTRGFHDA